MIDLAPYISRIENLLEAGDGASVNYAALECRLAIEAISYDKLRLAYKYISYSELRKWQPRAVLDRLVEDVDDKLLGAASFSISEEPTDGTALTQQSAVEQNYVLIGSRPAINVRQMHKLWNALSKLALHISLPTEKSSQLSPFENTAKTKEKILECLNFLKIHAESKVDFVFVLNSISFECECGQTNQRNRNRLKESPVFRCINPMCGLSYRFDPETDCAEVRLEKITCMDCKSEHEVSSSKIEDLRPGNHLYFTCSNEGCGSTIYISMRPHTATVSKGKHTTQPPPTK